MNDFDLHHDSCFDWLSAQPEDSIEAVCSDPPFGIVEFLPHEMEKMRQGRGGVWRLPPTIGGSKRAPLPRFTTLGAKEQKHVYEYFHELGLVLHRVLTPGAHVFLAGTPILQHLVQRGMAEAGFEVRGAIMRLYRGFRGGDRPKLAEKEFYEVCVTQRGTYEPWMLFRKPISERTVALNLRKWGTGALRRVTPEQPLPDTIQSGKTPKIEESISNHPTLKPQQFLRILTRSILPLGEGTVLDPFCGSGSTIAACKAIGYRSIGIEIDDQYFELIEKNVEKLSALYPTFKGDSLNAIDSSEKPKLQSAKSRQSDMFVGFSDFT